MSLDDLGNVRVDHVWGNMSMQPNDARGVNVLDPLLDNHQIAYLGWNGYPQYVPNTVGGGSGSGSGSGGGSGSGSGGGGNTAFFKTINNLYPTISTPEGDVLSQDMYGNSQTFRLNINDIGGEWPPVFGQSYGVRLSFEVVVPAGATTTFAQRLASAYNQNVNAVSSNPFYHDMYSGLELAEQLRNWNNTYLTLLPDVDLSDAVAVDPYGNVIPPLYANPGGEFSSSVNTASNWLIPGWYQNGTLYKAIDRYTNFNGDYVYTFNFSFPEQADFYGNEPTSSQAALWAGTDAYGNYQYANAGFVASQYGNVLLLNGTLRFGFPAA